jgi:hypothetical protein
VSFPIHTRWNVARFERQEAFLSTPGNMWFLPSDRRFPIHLHKK